MKSWLIWKKIGGWSCQMIICFEGWYSEDGISSRCGPIQRKALDAVKRCLNIEKRYKEIFAEDISSEDNGNYPYYVKADPRMVSLTG